MNYIVEKFPAGSAILNHGLTRTTFDVSRVPLIPDHIKRDAVSLVTDAEVAAYLGIKLCDGPKVISQNCTFWYVKVIGDGKPANSRIEYYRISCGFLNSLESFDETNPVDLVVYKLCQNRKVNPSEEGLTTNVVEFRCKELGIYPEREGKELILYSRTTNNEARVIAARCNLLYEYDKSYQHYLNEESATPVTSAMAEWDLL